MKINKIIIRFIPCVILFSSANLIAQSNVTTLLNAYPVYEYAEGGTTDFSNSRNLLQGLEADCFILTAEGNFDGTPPQEDPQRYIVFAFKLANNTVLEIGVEDHDHWFIRRKALIAPVVPQGAFWLDYDIYDDIGLSGKLTVIIGHHFIALAMDDGTTKFKLAPVFYGLDSNLGTLQSHAGEFTGETNYGYSRSFYMHQPTRVWAMSLDRKMSTLLNALNGHQNDISNAKIGNRKETTLSTNDIENEQLFEEFKLYPNPANGDFNIEFNLQKSTKASLKIINIHGQIVYSEEKDYNEGNNKHTINYKSGGLPSGVYFVTLSSNEYSKTTKLIVR